MESRKIIKLALSALGISIIIGYSYFVLEDFIRGPRIEITSPETGFSTTTPLIVISGRAIHTSVFTLNDASTTLDLKGNFSESLLLADRYNIINLKAEDRYHRVVEKRIEIVFLPTMGPKQKIGTSTPQVESSSDMSATTSSAETLP
ncbi:MAG: hypothetical protein AAB628_01275 [Patescibacteria group bacterium]|mgnify:CR=1 FL=1